MPVTRNLAEAIRRKLASDNDLATAADAERFNLNVGSVIYEARNNAGLTQQQLADRVGMHQSAIARLEDADYYGHSLKTLERIAAALGKRLEVVFVDQCVNTAAISLEELPPPEWPSEDWPIWEPNITTTGPSLAPNTRSLVA